MSPVGVRSWSPARGRRRHTSPVLRPTGHARRAGGGGRAHHPERMLRGRDERGHRIPGLTVDIDGDLHQILLTPADDRGHNLLGLALTGVGIGGHHPIPELDLLDRLGRTVGQQHPRTRRETLAPKTPSARLPSSQMAATAEPAPGHPTPP